MRLLLNILSIFGLSLSYSTIAFAHETKEMHEEPPAIVDPVAAVIVVVVILVGLFLLWKFVLKAKTKSS